MPTELDDVRNLDAGLFSKVIEGSEGLKKLNSVDAARFVGVLSLKATGTLGVIGGAADTVADLWDVGRQRDDLSKLLELDGHRSTGPVVREADDEDSAKGREAVGRGVAVTAAGMGAMALATAKATAIGAAAGTATGVPIIGTAVGAGIGLAAGIAGSIVGKKVFDGVVASDHRDTLGLIGKLRFGQMKGIEISAEAAFATWAASNPDKTLRERMEKRLAEITNGKVKFFHQAVTEDRTKELRQLMSEFNDDMALDFPELSFANSKKTIAERLADQMNNRKEDGTPVYDANNFINRDQLALIEAMYKANDVPKTGVSVADNGINVDPSVTSLQPFPEDLEGGPGKKDSRRR